MIYFDNAATTYPKPQSVYNAICAAPKIYGANPGRSGHAMSLKTALAVYDTREAAAKLFGMPQPENVILTNNCTHGLNIVILGLLQAGDHVLISDLEHNSVLRPVHALSITGGISYDVIQTCPEDSAKTVQAFAAKLRKNTKLIICTHGSNVFGYILPVQELCHLAHQHGALFLTDAAQTAGVLDIAAKAIELDYLATAGHKGLYGPTGTGLLLINSQTIPRPLMMGGTGSASQDYTQPSFLPDALESGTANTVGAVALGAGIRHVLAKTPAHIYKHEMALIAYLYRELQKCKDITLYTQRPQLGAALPVLSFNIKDYTGEEAADKLATYGIALRGGLHCAPLAHKKNGTLQRGTVRVSVGSFNTMREAEKFCNIVKKI